MTSKLTFSALTRTGGAIAGAFGFLALLGWVLELPFLTSLGSHWIPMAPSTALLFVLLGGAVFASAATPISRPVKRAVRIIGSVTTLAAMLLFFLFYQGLQPDAEHFGRAIADSAIGVPTGHMSPVTALGFVLAGLSLPAGSAPNRRWRVLVGSCLAGFLICAALVFLLAYLFGVPLLYGGTIIPPALTTSVAFAALGLGLLTLAARHTGVSVERRGAANRRASRYLILLFMLVVAVLVGIGILYSRHQEKLQREHFEHQLSAIAELKAADLAQWRTERLADAAFLSRNAVFAELVRRAVANPQDRPAQERVHGWLQDLNEIYDYTHIHLFDAQGVVRISVPDRPVPADETSLAREVLRTGQVIFKDFHRDTPGDAIHLGLLVPLLGENKGNQSVGVLYIGIEPTHYLYPFIQRWSVPSDSGETLLVRREGEEVVFLNELRFRKNTALALREPLTKTQLPAVQAALGHEGIAEGVDYRGVPVIASIRPVPGSRWFLVAKIDKAEALAPAQAALWLVAGLVSALLLVAATGVGFLWRQQRLRSAEARARSSEALAAAVARLHEAQRLAHIGNWERNLQTGALHWGKELYRIFGLPPEAIASLEAFLAIVHPDDLKFVKQSMQDAFEKQQPYHLDLRIRCPDGTERILHTNGEVERDADGKPIRFFGTIQDVTEEKRAEEQIQHYLQQLETAFMSTVEVATNLSEMRDPYTAGHARRVGAIAVAIGTELGFDARAQEGLRVVGYLHDIGKISIPTEILCKPGRLDPIEFDLIKEHAQAGYDILKDVEFPWPVAEVAHQHHERIDGSGYPQGLKGEAILLEARILAVADVIEAMSSHRPYRAGLGIEAALSEIEHGRGSVYDPAVVDACLKLFREKGYAIPG